MDLERSSISVPSRFRARAVKSADWPTCTVADEGETSTVATASKEAVTVTVPEPAVHLPNAAEQPLQPVNRLPAPEVASSVTDCSPVAVHCPCVVPLLTVQLAPPPVTVPTPVPLPRIVTVVPEASIVRSSSGVCSQVSWHDTTAARPSVTRRPRGMRRGQGRRSGGARAGHGTSLGRTTTGPGRDTGGSGVSSWCKNGRRDGRRRLRCQVPHCEGDTARTQVGCGGRAVE